VGGVGIADLSGILADKYKVKKLPPHTFKREES
jgi:hypothetical protein